MRYLIICLFLSLGSVFAQTPKKLSSYPAAPSFDPEDLFFVSDGGTTSRKMTGLLMQNWIQAADDGVRIALADTAAVLRTMIGGGGLFQKSLGRIRSVNINDSLGVGVSPTLGKFQVEGNSWFNGTVSTTALTLITGGLVYMNGDDMMFYDNTNGLVALSSLVGGGSQFTKTGTTNFATITTDNWHIGGSTETTHKLKITGNFNVTESIYLGSYKRLQEDAIYGGVSISSYGVLRGLNITQESNAVGLYSMTPGIAGGTKNGILLHDDYTVFKPGADNWYLENTLMRNSNDTLATKDYARNYAGTGGGGIVDTTGLPVANQVTYFTSATKIAGNNNFTFDGDSVGLGYLDPVASGTRFIVLTESAKLDSGVLNPVSVGLTDPLWDIHKHLADRQNKEISWYHIDDKTGKLVKTYKLANNMNAFEQLQYTAEMSLRLIAEQDKRIALLERKEYRMNRQDYKYKAKLLKLENRLK